MIRLILFSAIIFFVYKLVKGWRNFFKNSFLHTNMANSAKRQQRRPWKDDEVENADFEEID